MATPTAARRTPHSGWKFPGKGPPRPTRVDEKQLRAELRAAARAEVTALPRGPPGFMETEACLTLAVLPRRDSLRLSVPVQPEGRVQKATGCQGPSRSRAPARGLRSRRPSGPCWPRCLDTLRGGPRPLDTPASLLTLQVTRKVPPREPPRGLLTGASEPRPHGVSTLPGSQEFSRAVPGPLGGRSGA